MKQDTRPRSFLAAHRTACALTLVLAIGSALSIMAADVSAREAPGGRPGRPSPAALMSADAPTLERAPGDSPNDFSFDPPARSPEFVRTDTVYFGGHDPDSGYAIQGETWTWDHDQGGPPFDTEGWLSLDQTTSAEGGFRRITAASWADHGNDVPVPLIAVQASLWCGAFEDHGDSLCWAGGLGYGNLWCQRVTSPELIYGGSGGITLSLRYFNDSEQNYDYTRIFLRKGSTEILLNESGPNADDGFSSRINLDCSSSPCRPAIPAQPWTRTLTAAQMGEAGPFTIRFEFTSDGGWSDEDGEYATDLGPFCADDIRITGGAAAVFDFETDLQGWAAETCPGIGSYFGIAELSDYSIPDPCQCGLSGRVMELHDGVGSGGSHPDGQWEQALSPIIDRTHLPDFDVIFADMDMYADMPAVGGVVFRIGWQYYPFICPHTGEAVWSERSGTDTWFIMPDAGCHTIRDVATNVGVPPDCQYVRLVIEILRECIDIPCSGDGGYSPLFDNVRVGLTHNLGGPVVRIDSGGRFQDGFPQQAGLTTNGTGNADITRDLHMQDESRPDLLGDSLSITGPTVNPQGSNSWEARLWFRVAREGPAQNTIPRYNTWLFRVKDAHSTIVGPNAPFTSGWMDSVETALVQKNRFCSQFRENDDDFAPGPPGVGYDQGEDNEILWDGIFTPGTKIEYFITTNYICTPNEMYHLPDTSGGRLEEFEILPSYRMDDGVAKYPCLLYVDADNAGAQVPIQGALSRVLHGLPPGSPVPDPAAWDRYDYLDAASNWGAPLFRSGPGSSNAGATIAQLLGYRAILVSTGGTPEAMDARDWSGLAEWLQVTQCSGNLVRQGLILNGDNVAVSIDQAAPSFLTDIAGADLVCGAYSDADCPPGSSDNDQNECVRLELSPGGPYAPALPLDLYGNWCPSLLSYDVVGSAGGVANKVYRKVDTGTETEYAQVANDQSGPGNPANYRTLLDGFSYHHLSARDLEHPGPDSECPKDRASVEDGCAAEVGDALRWVLGIADPMSLGLCVDPCDPEEPGAIGEPGAGDSGSGGPGSAVNALFPSQPNPFNPRTVIRYSLAAAGPARIDLFDASGRRVRTLVNARREPGEHLAVWDGTDDAGRPVGSGVYWSRLEAAGYASSRKLVLLGR